MTSDGSENNPNKTEKPATTTMTNSCTDDTNTFKPPPPAFAGEQGKRARFYRNGDQFFKVLLLFLSNF
jgi:hypothetical protein